MNKPINLTTALRAYRAADRAHREMTCASPSSQNYSALSEAYVEKAEARAVALAPITAAIAEAEGHSLFRLLTFAEIAMTVELVEDRLCLPKAAMIGLRIWCDPHAQHFAKAYAKASHGTKPMSTQFELEYRKAGWYLTNVRRCACTNTSNPLFQPRKIEITTFPETAKQALINSYASGERF